MIKTNIAICSKCKVAPINSNCICGNLATIIIAPLRLLGSQPTLRIYVDDIDTISFVPALLNRSCTKIRHIYFEKPIFNDNISIDYIEDSIKFRNLYLNYESCETLT